MYILPLHLPVVMVLFYSAMTKDKDDMIHEKWPMLLSLSKIWRYR
jgi:hypothetical protein